MLFSRRVGFSGTPSDLLPEELGQCYYDEGVDGKIYHYLTSDSIMSSRVLGTDWTVTKILDGTFRLHRTFISHAVRICGTFADFSSCLN